MLNKFLENISKIDSKNEAINFIIKRFSSDKKKYRGMQLFQHNRYDEEKMYKILEAIKSVFIELKLEKIKFPKGDENNGKNKGFYLSDYPEYEKIIKRIKKVGCGGTANTLKKNYFPDWEKSGIINRTKNNEFSLNKFIIENSEKEWNKIELYKQHINELLPPTFIENIYYLLEKFKKITYYEFLLFVNYIYSLDELGLEQKNNNDNLKYIEGLIKSWRELTEINKNSLIENLKQFMDPKKYQNVSKDKKKDWGNFNNETQQIFSSLGNANLFQITGIKPNEKKIVLRSLSENKEKMNFKRNKDIYKMYHKENLTNKIDGFEMDHIVKFSLISKPEDVPYIDNYLNLLYIDGYSHSIKSQNGSNHMILKYDGSKFTLEDYRKISDPIILKFDENVLINKNKIDEYIKHNKKLLLSYVLQKNM